MYLWSRNFLSQFSTEGSSLPLQGMVMEHELDEGDSRRDDPSWEEGDVERVGEYGHDPPELWVLQVNTARGLVESVVAHVIVVVVVIVGDNVDDQGEGDEDEEDDDETLVIRLHDLQ